MSRPASITRRLIVAVLLLEVLAALGLVAAITVNQRHVQYKAFDAYLHGSANALLSGVQEGEDNDVLLDMHGLKLPRDAVYRVTDEHGRVLGASGEAPQIELIEGLYQNSPMHGRSYRFFVLSGERIIDPEKDGGIHHHITILYGQPDGHVWHEIFEAVRFFAIATAVLVGATTLLLIWLIRRLLSPILTLAAAAEGITVARWEFHAPEDAKRFVELRPLASAIETTVTRLQRAFEQQKRFTSDAAHELKTDLAIVKSSLQLLSMKQRTPEEYARGLAVSLGDFTRLETTVQTMLTLARLEQPPDTAVHACDLNDVLEEVVQQSNSFADMRHISLVLLDHVQVAVPLDKRDAQLLCANIVLNALQHSPDGAQVEVGLLIDGPLAQLTVRDHGDGFADEDRPHVFEPFYRGDPSRSRKSGGTGLGLSICKAICDRVGGSISITNHASGGAVVQVTLPLAN